jgi:hypothetical protein
MISTPRIDYYLLLIKFQNSFGHKIRSHASHPRIPFHFIFQSKIVEEFEMSEFLKQYSGASDRLPKAERARDGGGGGGKANQAP